MGRNKNKEISSALYKKIAPLLPVVAPSAKGGRPRLSDEQALNGIVFVLRTGIPWEELPQQLGFGSGMTCWRRLRDWQVAQVWHNLHLLLLAELRSAGKLDFSRVSTAACERGSIVSSTLARKRAEQVMRKLTSLGIDPSRLFVVSRSASVPCLRSPDGLRRRGSLGSLRLRPRLRQRHPYIWVFRWRDFRRCSSSLRRPGCCAACRTR